MRTMAKTTAAGILPLLLCGLLALIGTSISTALDTTAQDLGHQVGNLHTGTAKIEMQGRRLQVDGQTCSNGLPGYEAADVCCPLSCGKCGGSGCSKRGEGCCTSDVKESGDLCSETKAAPCNIDGDVVVDDQTCSNGLPGYEAADVCCPLSCGKCGGSGCSKLGDGCCTSDVKDSGDLCSETKAAPCIIDDDDVVVDEEDPICTYTDFKFAGYEGEQTCCAVECGTCESEGCEDRPGGPDACCPAIIDEFGDHCDNPDTEGAPCYLFEKFTDGDFVPVEPSRCSNGFPGYESSSGACCSYGCGTCGGSGCSELRGGAGACCTSSIFDAGELCSDKGYAPCIVG